MAAIKSDTLRATKLPVPSLGEMETIEAILRAISTETVAKRELLSKLFFLKTALMQDLLTGHVRFPEEIQLNKEGINVYK